MYRYLVKAPCYFGNIYRTAGEEFGYGVPIKSQALELIEGPPEPAPEPKPQGGKSK